MCSTKEDNAPRGVLSNTEVGGLGPHIKFGGKLWGKVRPSSPTKRKKLGSAVTTRHKSWKKVPILGSYLKFRGQNLVFLSFIFLEAKVGLQQGFQRQNLGPSPPPRLPNVEVPPWDNAAQLRILSSGKLYLSMAKFCIINVTEDIQYRFVSFLAQPGMYSMQLSQI